MNNLWPFLLNRRKGEGKKWGRKMCVFPLWYRVHMLHIRRRGEKKRRRRVRAEGLDVLTQRLQLAGRPLKTLDTMTHSLQGVMRCRACVRLCVCSCVRVFGSNCAAYSLSRAPRRPAEGPACSCLCCCSSARFI